MKSSSIRYSLFAIRALIAAALLAAATETAMGAPKDDTITTAEGPVEVHAIHHASLMLTWHGKHLLIDPAPVPGADPAKDYKALPKPDAILYTHGHYDHFDAGLLAAIAGPGTQIVAPQEVFDAEPKAFRPHTMVLKNGDKAVLLGIPVEAVPMYNTSPEKQVFHPKGKGNGYIFTFGDKRVYVAGDTEEAPELAHLKDIDAAFLPMNLPYTLSVPAAAQWVKDFRPHIVYPYHFRNSDGTLSDLDAFEKDVGGVSEVRVLEWY